MGWFDSLFNLGNVKTFYNGVKQTLGNIYSPIKSVVNTIADGIKDVDGFISKGKDIPIIRELVGVIQSNPIYSEIVNGSGAVRDLVNEAGQVGGAIDSAIGAGLDIGSAASNMMR